MKKKYNNKSNKFSEWTTKKLKDEAKGYCQMIYRVECYGTKDICTLDGIMSELDNRGVKYHYEYELIF